MGTWGGVDGLFHSIGTKSLDGEGQGAIAVDRCAAGGTDETVFQYTRVGEGEVVESKSSWAIEFWKVGGVKRDRFVCDGEVSVDVETVIS